MFTGLIEDIGVVRGIKSSGLTIATAGLDHRLGLGDSVAVNGVCLTVTRLGDGFFDADISRETLSKTTLGELRPGHQVNLETSLTLNKPLGGHFLQGHVDCVGTVARLDKSPDSWIVLVQFPETFAQLVVERGSIGLEGVSLTIAGLEPSGARLALIPHTIEHTTLRVLERGQKVNLEFDILGKYVLRFLELGGGRTDSPLTWDRLRDLGY